MGQQKEGLIKQLIIIACILLIKMIKRGYGLIRDVGLNTKNIGEEGWMVLGKDRDMCHGVHSWSNYNCLAMFSLIP